MKETTLENIYGVREKIEPRRKDGTVAPVDGKPVITILQGLGTFEQDADGFGVIFYTQDEVSDIPEENITDFKTTVDADLGQGMKEVSGIYRLITTKAGADSIEFVGGEVVSKPVK